MQNIVMLRVDQLHPHPDNPRKDLGDLTELTNSIRAKGVLQNLTVIPGHWLSLEEYLAMAKREGVTKDEAKAAYRPKEYWEPTDYTIIIGHRRHAASNLAELAELPCVITEMTYEEQISTMMVENLQRNDLSVAEEAYGFQMMLDLGQTVDQVAKSTGFSKSTIHKRTSLTRLEEKGFKLAVQRGATMQDLLKLNKIQNEGVRNKVLAHAGTSEFQQKLNDALADQKVEEFCAGILEQLKAADWCKERTTENVGSKAGEDYVYYKDFGRYNQKPLVTPSDTDTAKYIYVVNHSRSITLYRFSNVEKPKSAEDLRKEAFKAAYSEATEAVKSACKIHRDMRFEFIQNFSALNSYEPEIVAWAIRLTNTAYGKPNQSVLGKLLGIPVHKPDTFDASVDAASYERELRNRPTYALLCALYAKLDGPMTNFYEGSYNNILYVSTVKHKKNPALVMLYNALLNLGYEMSEDEKLMQSGKHPALKAITTLDDRWKKGLNADGTDPKDAANLEDNVKEGEPVNE